MLGVAAWLSLPWLSGAREACILDRPLRCTFSAVAVLTAAWLFTIPEGISSEHRMGYVKNMQGRALWYLLVTYLLGEIVWALAGAGAFSMRVYTLWAFLQVLFFPILYARVIDAWHVHSRTGLVRLYGLAPVLGILVLLVVVAALPVSGPSDVGRPGPHLPRRKRLRGHLA